MAALLYAIARKPRGALVIVAAGRSTCPRRSRTAKTSSGETLPIAGCAVRKHLVNVRRRCGQDALHALDGFGDHFSPDPAFPSKVSTRQAMRVFAQVVQQVEASQGALRRACGAGCFR